MLARYTGIDQFNIEYFLGADGISMPLILLTTVLFFLSMIASWNIAKYVRGYCMLFLILETGVLGSFIALDFFLFYIFWEVMLLPMYFLIGVWGGPRREYAAMKFFLYTLLGSVFILIAMLGFYFTDVRDFVPRDRVTEAVSKLTKNYQKADPKLSEAEAIKKARNNAEVHSFDLIVLAKAGKTALHFMNDYDKEKKGHRQETGEGIAGLPEKMWRIGFKQSFFSEVKRSSIRCSCCCSSASPSRCRSFRSTPGCRTPTSRRRRRSA